MHLSNWQGFSFGKLSTPVDMGAVTGAAEKAPLAKTKSESETPLANINGLPPTKEPSTPEQSSADSTEIQTDDDETQNPRNDLSMSIGELKKTQTDEGPHPETQNTQSDDGPNTEQLSTESTVIQTDDNETQDTRMDDDPNHRTQNTPIGLGYLSAQANPDAEEPPVVAGVIAGKPAWILLDSGCSTYILDTEFMASAGVSCRTTPPIPVELAVRNASQTHLRTKTDELSMSIGELQIKKAFYPLPLPRYDAIVGMPFIKEFDVSFPTGKPVAKIGKTEIPLVVEEDDKPCQISLITRSRLKAMVRRNECEEIYIASTRILEDEKPQSTEMPDWIRDEFGNVFLEGLPPGMPPERRVQHQITLHDPHLPPPFRSIFRLSQAELQEMRKQLQTLLRDGKISPSVSPYGAPVLFTKKKGGGLRMCIDYRALNSQTIKNRYALPRIDDLVDQLHGAKIFTKIDLTSGYWQIAIAPEDRHKTAFRTRYGHYEFNVMPFGLTNAPASFQSLMNDIFRDMLDECVVIYLDDILIYSKTVEEHKEHVRRVLKRLQEHQLFAKASKCSFFVDTIEYLGFIVGPDGVKPNPDLISALERFPRPHTLKELQSFLGLANYYRKFVDSFSKIAAPLTNAMQNTSNSRPVIWNPGMEEAFEHLKVALATAPCLHLPDPEGEFEVTTDASENASAVGAVLTQNGHPVAFESRKLDKHQVNYPVHDKEMYAIMYALEKWRPFLLGNHFKVFTDHRSLVHFKSQPNLNQRQLRWMEKAADYDCEILYKPGKENVVADALSRITINALSPAPNKSITSAIIKAYRREPFKSLITGVERKDGTSTRYTIKEKLLYYRTDEYEHWRLCLPDIPYRQQVIHDNHDLAIAGHPGFVQTYSKIARLYYWPNMSQDIRKHTRECDACQRTKASTRPPAGELQPLPIPERPWKSIGMDFVGPLPKSKDGKDMVLVVVDRFTKMAHFVPTTCEVTSKKVAELFLQNVFRYHGLPESIVSDRDPRFTAKFWQALNEALGIKLLMSTAAHPQTDGQAEATVKIIQKLIRPFTFQEQDWEILLPSLEFAYNDTQQSSTGQTPFYLNYGHHPVGTYRHADTRNPHAEDHVQYLLRLQEAARDAIHDAQSVQQKYANKHRRPSPEIKEGDWVLLKRRKEEKRKLAPIADGPFKVIKVGTNNVTLKFPKNSHASPTVNISRVQIYFGPRPELITAPPKDDSEHDYPVDRVMGHKRVDGEDYYYIHWKGYPAEDDSWEPKTNLSPQTLKKWEDSAKTRRNTQNPQL
jgi:hypothetical protein